MSAFEHESLKVDREKRCVHTLFKAKQPTLDNWSHTGSQISAKILVAHTRALDVPSEHRAPISITMTSLMDPQSG